MLALLPVNVVSIFLTVFVAVVLRPIFSLGVNFELDADPRFPEYSKI
jgi:hypothetical protein